MLPAQPTWASKAGEGVLKLRVVDKATGQVIPCRIHLKNQANVSRKTYGLPFWFDHIICPGEIDMKLPKGGYTFVIERGPEYVDVTGHFQINDYSEDEKTVELKRAVDMAAESWWAGDMHICRPLREIELAMQAEDLHVAGLVTWDNKKTHWAKEPLPTETTFKFDNDRYYHLLTGKDARAGGTLLLFGLPRPLGLTGMARDFPPSLDVVGMAKQSNPNVWIDVEKPYWWDLPLWLAAGAVDSIELLNSHMLRGGMTKNEAWGKTRDRSRYPDPLGNGYWSEAVYHQVLNAGFRIPPSAGSGSGEANNPVGYNRVYVWSPKDGFDADAWWAGLKAGRCIVTNGPLIRPIANSQLPGHVFRVKPGEEFTVEVALNMATRDPIAYVEVVENGRVAQSVRMEILAKTGRFPPLKITKPGWFLVRAVTQNEETYRMASSGPWYVEYEDQPPRVSRAAAQMFLNWVQERAAMIRIEDAEQKAAAMRYIDGARIFWEKRLAGANAP